MSDTPQLLVADSFRVRVNSKTGAAEVRGLQQHLDRFKSSARTAWCGEHRASTVEVSLHDAAMKALRASQPERSSASLLVFTPAIWTAEERHALDMIETFLADALHQIAGYGEGWPRLELWRDRPGATPRLALQLRQSPPLSETIELRAAGHIKTETPETKGPNIARFAALNRELGAEALLLDKRGHVLEGATTSLLWWPRSQAGSESSASAGSTSTNTNANAGTEICGAVVESRARVDSITERLLIMAGGRRLVGTKPNRRRSAQPQPRRTTVEQLMQHEVWAVNALHGIRVVTSINGVAQPAPDERRLRWFREALDRSWEPVLR